MAANGLHRVGCAKLIIVIEEHDVRKRSRYLFYHLGKIQVGATVPGLFANFHYYVSIGVCVGGVVGAYDVESPARLLQHAAAAVLEIVWTVAGTSEDG
jgi:hypothetical protein